ncbi:MAG TPA: PLP-dependent aminotransferase family protein [Myxococcales bacterium]|nr:GntR family transcriptional regulator [Deltaproteobacteria bacterium]MBU49852.1 GntR family transcriptional regulator [Deltaproteobacteria bacterium]HAA55091.1 PLP-dependent aminotransferase family protein [Myxococcales bacterium]|tara:strand:- start:43081 stop:44619 length:1539 start_codon:yes stop_codon:yes gene_type:complete
MNSKVGQSIFIVSFGRGEDCQVTIDKAQKEQHPLYMQIADGVVRLIRDGQLPDGARLPTVRELSQGFAVTRVTVQNAYNELKTNGWADATIGRGTFVTFAQPVHSETIEIAVNKMTPDRVMADLSVIKEKEDIISLAMGEPDRALLPAKAFMKTLRQLEADANVLFSYGPYQGDPQLRQMLASLLRERGVRASAEEFIITTGVTQGLSLSVSALCDVGDRVLVEQPTYLGFLNLLKTYQLQPLGVPMLEDGPCVETIERFMREERPRAYYTVPQFHNPTGSCMSLEKRKKILALAKQYDVTIIEDDVYGQLHYGEGVIQPMKALDTDDIVVYLGSFSKMLFPGVRVGFMIPPTSFKERLMSFVRARELCGSPFVQRGLAEFMRSGALHKHLSHILPIYKERCDAMLAALGESMPKEVAWTRPEGGYCCWVTLPEEIEFGELYRETLRKGVAFTPGVVFFQETSSTRHLRLCFCTQTPQSIHKAIRILGDVVRRLLRRPSKQSLHMELQQPVV